MSDLIVWASLKGLNLSNLADHNIIYNRGWMHMVCHISQFILFSTRFVGKPENQSAMYFWLILTIFSGGQYKLGGWEAPEGGVKPPTPRQIEHWFYWYGHITMYIIQYLIWIWLCNQVHSMDMANQYINNHFLDWTMDDSSNKMK